MSDDKLNEVVSNNELFDKNELLSDESSSEMKEKKSNKKKSKVEVEAQVNNEIVVEAKVDKKKKTESIIKIEVQKSQLERYTDMLSGKNFEVRFKGKLIFDSISKIKYSLNDLGIVIGNNVYKYSEVIIRIKN